MAELRVCVFCGASPGTNPNWLETARRTGDAIARRGWTLVYGAGSSGMMGAVGAGALAAGGRVVGIIPTFLTEWEPPLGGLTELIEVRTMAERKTVMANRSDVFISLPGGIGTMDEFFEMWTLESLEIQRAPSALLDVDGYFQPLLTLMDHMVTTGFLRQSWRELVLVDADLERLLDRAAAVGEQPVCQVGPPMM